MQTFIQRQTNLPAHVVQFSRYLRENGFEIGPNEELDVLKAFEAHVPTSLAEQQHLYKAILVKNRRQFVLFEELYKTYWKELSRAEDSKTKEQAQPNMERQRGQQQAPSLQALKSWLYAGRIQEEQEVAAYSAFEAIGQRDFSMFNTNEHQDLLAIIRLIAQQLANKHSRRYVRSRAQKTIDLKNTIRQSLRKGGQVDRFFFKEQNKRKVNLVLLCDVSKSMELYSKFLIEFMYSFQQVVHQLKTFAFSTRLVSLSRVLRDGNFEKVLSNLADQVPYWAGGTRIGASLAEFTTNYGGKLLNKDSIVIIVSDGWDTGETDVLEHAMRFLHRKSNQVIWLNPLAGNPDYKPATQAMQTALPFIDVFGTAHNLDSLQSVARMLKVR